MKKSYFDRMEQIPIVFHGLEADPVGKTILFGTKKKVEAVLCYCISDELKKAYEWRMSTFVKKSRGVKAWEPMGAADVQKVVTLLGLTRGEGFNIDGVDYGLVRVNVSITLTDGEKEKNVSFKNIPF